MGVFNGLSDSSASEHKSMTSHDDLFLLFGRFLAGLIGWSSPESEDSSIAPRCMTETKLSRRHCESRQISYLFPCPAPSTPLLCTLKKWGYYIWNELCLDSGSLPLEGVDFDMFESLRFFRTLEALGSTLLGKLSSESESKPEIMARLSFRAAIIFGVGRETREERVMTPDAFACVEGPAKAFLCTRCALGETLVVLGVLGSPAKPWCKIIVGINHERGIPSPHCYAVSTQPSIFLLLEIVDLQVVWD